MQTIIFALLVGFLNPILIDRYVEISDHTVKVTFDRKMDFNALVKIKLDLAEKGISIFYKKIVFTKYKELQEISFDVDCNDGFAGSASESNLSNNRVFGFIRDYKGDVSNDHR